MKQIIIWLLCGLVLLSCSKSSPGPALVGTWERMSRRTVLVYKDSRAPYDQTDVDPPGSYFWEFTPDGQFKIINNGNNTVATSTYTYSRETLTLNASSSIIGTGIYRVTELTDHRLVLSKYQDYSDLSSEFIHTFTR
ncbi:hypothetical protein BEN47_17855 [Hymenobacter lapidarius]|uniref:Lipocalin-like domain-containing protein n=1 Tax=Hymenobacter lapidarius TaxID=1908237 RepID=A0A1G1SWY7_9BACT|nr:hypothetical protein BEN47_17855 [Hymenobacter lapidarius]